LLSTAETKSHDYQNFKFYLDFHPKLLHNNKFSLKHWNFTQEFFADAPDSLNCICSCLVPLLVDFFLLVYAMLISANEKLIKFPLSIELVRCLMKIDGNIDLNVRSIIF
jgi:hypothetical protein